MRRRKADTSISGIQRSRSTSSATLSAVRVSVRRAGSVAAAASLMKV